jgi:hypothetical protein
VPFKSIEAKRKYQNTRNAEPEVKARRKETFSKWAGKNKEARAAYEAKRRLERRASVMVATARTRARKRGLAFDLEKYVPIIQERIDAGACEITGISFDLSPGRKFNSPSIDRIDPHRGYTYDNIRLVLNLVNAALGDWGEQTLREVMGTWLCK